MFKNSTPNGSFYSRITPSLSRELDMMNYLESVGITEISRISVRFG